MNVLGVNFGHTKYGKTLRAGGACLVADDRIAAAVSEERLSRIKYDAGFSRAFRYCLESRGLSPSELDLIVVSSCCEPVPDVNWHAAELFELPTDRVLAIDHHLAHASSVFLLSPFDRALVVVMDAGGNVLAPMENGDWWRYPREQVSYYSATGTDIELIARDFVEPYECGLGEAYRAFTYFLGWHSHVHSAHTMALAAYGDPRTYEDVPVFELRRDRLFSRLENNPPQPIEMVSKLLLRSPTPDLEPRLPGEAITAQHMDVARWIQHELERALAARISQLCRTTSHRQVCLAGGVALNCIANRKVLDLPEVDEVFVQPACGDEGQSLGNALYGLNVVGGRRRLPELKSASLGRTDLSAPDYLKSYAQGTGLVVHAGNVAAEAAQLLARGGIVAWFQGGAEIGPRALGHRSILAHPGMTDVSRKISSLKSREWFRPYAPSVLAERAGECFDLSAASPFMLLVGRATGSTREMAPAILHIDDSARLQTVARETEPLYHDLITRFYRLTGVPMLLNTSFNVSGSPIVETIGEALEVFNGSDIDALAVGDVLVTKT